MRPTPIPGRGVVAGRLGEQVQALATDRYLDGLLARDHRGLQADAPAVAPADRCADDPDASVRRAADVVRASLLRVHPSFRFEERLADRLAALAALGADAATAARPRRTAGTLRLAASTPVSDPLLEAVLDGRLDPADERAVAAASGPRSPARPLIVGGAITSAAISLAGVAWVAWRASHGGASPMSRAVRGARERRLAQAPVGGHGGRA